MFILNHFVVFSTQRLYLWHCFPSWELLRSWLWKLHLSVAKHPKTIQTNPCCFRRVNLSQTPGGIPFEAQNVWTAKAMSRHYVRTLLETIFYQFWAFFFLLQIFSVLGLDPPVLPTYFELKSFFLWENGKTSSLKLQTHLFSAASHIL